MHIHRRLAKKTTDTVTQCQDIVLSEKINKEIQKSAYSIPFA